MTDQIKLTDAQSVILSLAAQHEDGITTDMIAAKVTVAKPKRAADSLAKRGLLVVGKFNIDGILGAPGYRITAEGKSALGIEYEASTEDAEDAADATEATQEPDAATWPEVKEKAGLETKARKPRTGTKQEALIEMLKQPEGASAAEVMDRFGWQPHTVRGAIAGALKKKLGLTVTTEKVEGRGTVYRIPG